MEPIVEPLPEDTDLEKRFLACDLVNKGIGGTIYRAFAGSHFYVVLDTRRTASTQLAYATANRRLVALRFVSRDAREAWLSQVLQSAQGKKETGWNPPRGGNGSGGSGSAAQLALFLPISRKGDFKA